MARLVKIFVRCVGTLGAAWGVFSLFGLPSILRAMPESGVGLTLAFGVVPALIAAYMIWIGYLVWFRFSPRAVQHCCGLLGLFVLGFAANALVRVGEEPNPTIWRPLGMLAVLLAVLLGYRWLSRVFNRVLFPVEARAMISEAA